MSLDVIQPPSKEVQEKVWSAFGLNEKVIKESIEQIRGWLEHQHNLPKEVGTFLFRLNNTAPFMTILQYVVHKQVSTKFSTLVGLLEITTCFTPLNLTPFAKYAVAYSTVSAPIKEYNNPCIHFFSQLPIHSSIIPSIHHHPSLNLQKHLVMYLSTHPSMHSFMHPYIHTSSHPCIHPSLNPITLHASVPQFIYPFVHSFGYPCTLSSIREDIHAFIHSFLHPSIHPSKHPASHLPVLKSIWTSTHLS
jgi:hypothetical protein